MSCPGENEPVQVVCSAFDACANDLFTVDRVLDAADADIGLANDLLHRLRVIWGDNFDLYPLRSACGMVVNWHVLKLTWLHSVWILHSEPRRQLLESFPRSAGNGPFEICGQSRRDVKRDMRARETRGSQHKDAVLSSRRACHVARRCML